MYKTILFIGLGGAGQRHLRVVKKIIPNAKYIAYRKTFKTPLLTNDFHLDNTNTIEKKFKIKIYDDIESAYKEKPDLVIVSNPTSFHSDAIIRAAQEGADVITEKPGSASLYEAKKVIKVLEKYKSKFLISYQRRFHPLMEEFKKLIENNEIGDIYNINIKLNSNVKNWHPYEDYRELYACNNRLGGGVLLTESHEIDLMMWIFGKPKKIKSKVFQKISLGLDVEDSAVIDLFYDKYKMKFNLDFMSKTSERIIEIKGEKASIILDIDNQSMKINPDKKKSYIHKKNINNEKLFEMQLMYFINSKLNNLNYQQSLIDNIALIDECKKNAYIQY